MRSTEDDDDVVDAAPEDVAFFLAVDSVLLLPCGAKHKNVSTHASRRVVYCFVAMTL